MRRPTTPTHTDMNRRQLLHSLTVAPVAASLAPTVVSARNAQARARFVLEIGLPGHRRPESGAAVASRPAATRRRRLRASGLALLLTRRLIECGCDWEPEHGLELVLEDGARVTKVGPYDGHLTNAAAYADPTLESVVYVGLR